MKAYSNCSTKTIRDTEADWFRSAPFRKGGGGARHPRKKRDGVLEPREGNDDEFEEQPHD